MRKSCLSRGVLSRVIAAPLTLIAALLFPAPARAATANVGSLVKVSGPSPVPGDANCLAGQNGYLWGNAEVEPSIEVDPTNPNRLVASFQQDRWSNGAAQEASIAASSDGGATWAETAVPYQSCLGGPFERVSDAWVTVSPDGTMYQMVLWENLVFTRPPSQRTGMAVVRSTDHGGTWSAPVILDSQPAPEPAPPYFGQPFLHAHVDDKNSITADPNDSRYVYAVWDKTFGSTGTAPIMFVRSSDGGRRWEHARMIYDPAKDLHNRQAGTIGNILRVLPDGTLVDVMFRSWAKNARQPDLTWTNDDTNFDIAVIRSTDHGKTWSKRATRVSQVLDAFVFEPKTGFFIRSGDTIPSIAVNSENGYVYIAWQDTTVPWGPAQIRLSVSRDGGRTWSEPITASRTPPSDAFTDDAFTPVVAVNASGFVGVFYYDFRNYSGVPGPSSMTTDAWLATFSDDGTSLTFQDEERLTNATFDISHEAPHAGGFFLGDYQGLTTSGDSFLALFVMTLGTWPSFAPSPDNPDVLFSNTNVTDVFFRNVTITP